MSSEELLTVQEAYRAMFAFLAMQYRRTQSGDLGVLLGGMSLLPDGSPADASVQTEWEAAVAEARQQTVDAEQHLKK